MPPSADNKPVTSNVPPRVVAPVPTENVFAPVTEAFPFIVVVPATIKLPVLGSIVVPPTVKLELVTVAPSTVSEPPTVIFPFFWMINASEGVPAVPFPITNALSLASYAVVLLGV